MPSTTREYVVSWWLVPDAPVWAQQKGTVCLTADPPPWKTHLLGKPTRSENLASTVPGAMPRLLEVQWRCLEFSPRQNLAAGNTSGSENHVTRIDT